MIAASLVLLVAFSSPLAGSTAEFEKAKAKAATVKSLKLALKALAEPCDLYDVGGHECQARQKKLQKKLHKKSHYLYLGVVDQGLKLRSSKGSTLKMTWTPLVDGGGGIALTLSKPLKLSRTGAPVMRLQKLNAVLAEGVYDTDLERAMRLGQVAIEVIGKFGSVWQKNHRGAPVRCVIFKATHLRLSNSRNGKALADAKL